MFKTLNRYLSTDALLLAALMWLVFIIDGLVPFIDLKQYALYPRDWVGLQGIVFSPLLHANLLHIVSNTLPILVLATLIRLSIGVGRFRWMLLLSWLGTGLGTWLFSSAPVVGASGLVYAMIGFLLADAYFNPGLRSWGFALAAFFLYGGALLSLLSFLPHVSWAGHFCGLLSGIAIASVIKTPARITKKPH